MLLCEPIIVNMYNNLHSSQVGYIDVSNVDYSYLEIIKKYSHSPVYFDDIPELVRQYEERGEPLEEHDSYEEYEELEEYRGALIADGWGGFIENKRVNETKLYRMLHYGNATKAYEWAKELKDNEKYPFHMGHKKDNYKENPFPDLF